jgi:hypothetical protein
MDARYLEKCLYYDGVASLQLGNTQEVKSLVNTRVAPGGYVNIYGLPTDLNCFSYSYQERKKLFTGKLPEMTETQLEAFQKSHAILVMNNWDRTPTAGSMELFAWRLYLAQRTCDVNISGQRFPLLVFDSLELIQVEASSLLLRSYLNFFLLLLTFEHKVLKLLLLEFYPSYS